VVEELRLVENAVLVTVGHGHFRNFRTRGCAITPIGVANASERDGRTILAGIIIVTTLAILGGFGHGHRTDLREAEVREKHS
jgi:hypothetical protein